MATFPASLPTTSTIPVEASGTPFLTNHVASHQGAQDEIIAIATKVGADGSAVTTTHDYKLSEVVSADKAVGKTATQTLTNKTLTSPTITSPTLNLGTDAEGDIYYRNSSGALVRLPRGSDNHILKMNGNVPNWEAESVTVDASSTVKGIVEIATAAEITAGTATGSTGAVLAISPDQLASSTPVFNGSNLTGTRTKVNITTSDTTVANTVTETNLASVSIPSGTLSTNNGVRFTAYINFQSHSSGTNGLNLRLKYGTTTLVATSSITLSNGSSYTGMITGAILADGSASAQNGFMTVHAGGATGSVYNGNGATIYYFSSNGTATENSATNLNLILSAEWSAASANNTITISGLHIEKIV